MLKIRIAKMVKNETIYNRIILDTVKRKYDMPLILYDVYQEMLSCFIFVNITSNSCFSSNVGLYVSYIYIYSFLPQIEYLKDTFCW